MKSSPTWCVKASSHSRTVSFLFFAAHLANTIDYGPEAQLRTQEHERFAISELQRALRHIAGALNKLGREEIAIQHADDPFYAKLMDISISEVFLTEALKALKARYKAAIRVRGAPPNWMRKTLLDAV